MINMIFMIIINLLTLSSNIKFILILKNLYFDICFDIDSKIILFMFIIIVMFLLFLIFSIVYFSKKK